MIELLAPVPDEILRKPARVVDVEKVDSEKFAAFLDELRARMVASGGVGIAAPQVGERVAIALVRTDHQELVLVNPRVRIIGKRRSTEVEGCLSLPGRSFSVTRPQTISVTSHVSGCEPVTITASGKLARVIGHEVDHLLGVLVDRRGTEVDIVAKEAVAQ